jgi:hypothetical protein
MGAAPVMSLALRAAWYATLLVGTAAAHPIFYVGPHGSDAAGCPGTQERPFGTLQRALAAFRDSSSGGNASSRGGELLLLNGTYRLEQGVTISAADTAGLSVDGQELLRIASLHPGGAVLSGGVEIVGGSWSPARGVVDGWQALLPLSLRSFGSTAPARFRQLFVDGVRAKRTTFNLTWPLRRATVSDLQHSGSAPRPPGYGYPTDEASAWGLGYVTEDTSARSWPSSGAGPVEAVFTGRFATHGSDPHMNWPWNEARCPVERTEPLGASNLTLIRMAQPCFENSQRGGAYGAPDQSVGVPDHFENGPSAESLQEGEFYTDGEFLTYRAAPGKGPPHVAEIPLLETLLSVGPGATSVVIEGLVFAHAAWHQPSTAFGYISIQAGLGITRNLSLYPNSDWELMRSAVEIRGATNVHMRQCIFKALGGGGVHLGDGSSSCSIIASLFDDISGGGLYLGGVAGTAFKNATADAFRLSAINNHLRNTAVEYSGSVPVFGGYLASGLIAHNLLEHNAYSGISLGWGWYEVHLLRN